MRMPSPEHLLAPTFVFLWSTGFISAKLGLPHADALAFLSARYGVVIAVMMVAALALSASWPRDPRQAGHIALAGMLIHGCYLGGVFIAIDRGLPAGLTALVVGLQPVLTGIAAGWVLGERVSVRQWVGLAFGFVGTALVVTNSRAPGLGTDWPASALLAAVVALAGITLGTLYQKRFCPRFDLRSGAVIQFGASLLVTLPVAIVWGDTHIAWTGQFLVALGWAVVMLSVVAISLLHLLIRRGTAVQVTRLMYLTPSVTALIAWAMFGERLGMLAVIGMGVAAFGVWLSRQ